MSIGDRKRLDPEIFKLDYERMRRGWYSDYYFNNIVKILQHLSESGYHFQGDTFTIEGKGVSRETIVTGDMEVEMQLFTKREPFSIVAGTDNALAMIRKCSGYFNEQDEFVNTFDTLKVLAVQDGSKVEPWVPALKIIGRYRDFAILETPILGAIARRTRIATNVYNTLKAAKGKPILFFPARFDIHETQPGDGYAYRVAIEAYNQDARTNVVPFISTNSQGDWWGEEGGGTVSHSYILCFLRDTAEAMMQFAELLPVEVNRIVLVDTNNDCVRDSLLTARKMFSKYLTCLQQDDRQRAQKYRLFAVRLDTAGNMIDKCLQDDTDTAGNWGVCPRLAWKVREALDQGYRAMDIPEKYLEEARTFFRNIKIVATGGFDPERISLFESLHVPVDIYGVGSSLMRGACNDFTADVVKVKIQGIWYDMAKIGRGAVDNPDLEQVT